MAETGFSQLSDESDERSHSIFAGYQSTSIKDASATDEESQIHILKEEAKSSLDSDDQALVVRPTPVPMGIWCRDLDYEVNGKKVILQGVTMCAKPGELTAVIGSSGAGKTSLINCLLNRVKRGKVRGERGLNSLPINDDTARRHMRYVMSADTNLPYLTVKETLYYTAQLRLPNLNKQQQIAAADEVIQWLRLQVNTPFSILTLSPSKHTDTSNLLTRIEMLLHTPWDSRGLRDVRTFSLAAVGVREFRRVR